MASSRASGRASSTRSHLGQGTPSFAPGAAPRAAEAAPPGRPSGNRTPLRRRSTWTKRRPARDAAPGHQTLEEDGGRRTCCRGSSARSRTSTDPRRRARRDGRRVDYGQGRRRARSAWPTHPWKNVTPSGNGTSCPSCTWLLEAVEDDDVVPERVSGDGGRDGSR